MKKVLVVFLTFCLNSPLLATSNQTSYDISNKHSTITVKTKALSILYNLTKHPKTVASLTTGASVIGWYTGNLPLGIGLSTIIVGSWIMGKSQKTKIAFLETSTDNRFFSTELTLKMMKDLEDCLRVNPPPRRTNFAP